MSVEKCLFCQKEYPSEQLAKILGHDGYICGNCLDLGRILEKQEQIEKQQRFEHGIEND